MGYIGRVLRSSAHGFANVCEFLCSVKQTRIRLIVVLFLERSVIENFVNERNEFSILRKGTTLSEISNQIFDNFAIDYLSLYLGPSF